ncbi:triose-phosphate isomerase [Fusobacterium sp. IOR10]|uniref:triose-phosphate isomerase n=1 Tax=Fusobacterium sp. IOR10 TaxID=2665157 RepID=UPI0013D1BD38|nr:triose-phosphate isomerase [Fusobacterium sp. IOR10]
MRKTIIAGNWKMNKTNNETIQILNDLKKEIKEIEGISNIGVVIGTPFTALSDAVKTVENSVIKIAAQNVYPKESGAYTGEISPAMLKDIGVEYVILGHSERRDYFKESNSFINEKIKAVLSHNMSPIFCIGEHLEDREAGKVKEVITKQVKEGLANLSADEMKKVIVAYEPIWAIGTGKTATPEIAQETHEQIREVLKEMFGETSKEITIQYGGSMKPNNAKELLSQKDIDGGLIGGASLNAKDFSAIIKAAL